MDLFCPRCHASLSPEARFCPECAAPQLTIESAPPDTSSGSESGETANGYNAGPHVAWPAAIGTAALLSVPVGLLSSLLSFSTLWVIAGGVWTIALYRRRADARLRSLPNAGLTVALGSRIGCVFGVFTAVVATFADAVNLLVNRYGLHHGADIDGRLHSAMQAGMDRVLATNPDAASQLTWFSHFWLSADGQAGLVLASAILSAGSMLGFSALGCALGARWYGARPAWGK